MIGCTQGRGVQVYASAYVLTSKLDPEIEPYPRGPLFKSSAPILSGFVLRLKRLQRHRPSRGRRFVPESHFATFD